MTAACVERGATRASSCNFHLLYKNRKWLLLFERHRHMSQLRVWDESGITLFVAESWMRRLIGLQAAVFLSLV